MKFLLFPFALIYLLVTNCRNYLYDIKFFKSTSFFIPIISVGNLSMGGTGKTPHTAYLIELLKNRNNVAVLSRGYGRKTKGFILANEETTEPEIGDEPMMYNFRYGKEITVAVCENRVLGINSLIKIKNPDLVLLDDAFQHRKVKPGFSILLTDFNSLYSKDYLFPVGSLRESRKGFKRADLIMVTKCPKILLEKQKEEIRLEFGLNGNQQLFFSSINYSTEVISGEKVIQFNTLKNKTILLITGIAKPRPVQEYVSLITKKVVHLQYPDHFNFKEKEIKSILEKFNAMEGEKIMLTTEKDFMRLKSFKEITPYLYYLPIEIEIDRKAAFDELILEVVKNK